VQKPVRYASPIVQKIKNKNTSHVKKASVAFTESNARHTKTQGGLTEENIVHDSFDRGSIRHSIGMTGEILHQFMMVIPTSEARLVPLEFMPRVHLASHQGNRSPVVDAVKGDLPSTHGNVLEVIHQQVAPGIQSPGDIIRLQLEGLQFLCQGCDKERKESSRKAWWSIMTKGKVFPMDPTCDPGVGNCQSCLDGAALPLHGGESGLGGSQGGFQGLSFLGRLLVMT
jgi:hypothetical protein